MNIKKTYCTVLILFFCFIQAKAQEVLTIEQAMTIALENNFEIKIAKNNSKINETNVTIGNAGMLPTATANITDNNSITNSTQVRQDGTSTSLDNAKNNSLNYGVSIGWTVFDGMKMFAKLDQLKELQKLGDAELKRTILVKIAQVNSAYYDLVQMQQQLAALDTTIVISNQRLTLAKNRFSIGKASKLEVLNAQVDLNSDQVALLRQKEAYANGKILLNQHLARDPKIDFKVTDEVKVDNKLVLADLMDLAQKQNPGLEAQIINKRIAELQLKQVKADRYPTLRLTSGYNFSESQSSLGFTSETSSRGLNYGFNASMNIFDGFNQHRNEKVAKLQIENSQLAIEQQNTLLNTQLSTAFQTYLTNLELIDLEENNENIARQNLEITLDKFKIGTITTLDFRTAQLNYVNAKVRYSNAQYEAKLSEIALKELAGNINF
ncbi:MULTISPECIES: TolC family protein [Flavobacterium]|jgi:outer membrane protein TolC|uniref:Outer membrane channel protein n=1 Tax=Flavobacterium anhuiense TaxID=459526 RepID=A0AAC9GJS0_9FLAO|nr:MULTISPECIES: TolC family protein [Flavobacterium]AOC96930.1 outer membrane channel protein [Flavobacterium anhuiense]EJG02315.1 outer membrane efflux protein [Flavobacterium sp. F52]MXO04335.1 TolC family protein [Flavobacterium sp. HBTb2-11-1]